MGVVDSPIVCLCVSFFTAAVFHCCVCSTDPHPLDTQNTLTHKTTYQWVSPDIRRVRLPAAGPPAVALLAAGMLSPVLVTQACAAYIASAAVSAGPQSTKALVHSVHSVLMLQSPMPQLDDNMMQWCV